MRMSRHPWRSELVDVILEQIRKIEVLVFVGKKIKPKITQKQNMDGKRVLASRDKLALTKFK
jgi:hypothetical protein